jgi:hypothetical protein
VKRIENADGVAKSRNREANSEGRWNLETKDLSPRLGESRHREANLERRRREVVKQIDINNEVAKLQSE